MYTKLHILALAFLMSGCGAAPRKVEVIEEEAVVTRGPAKAIKAGNNHIELENSAQLNDLIASGKLVIVDFFATWCGPCKLFGPVFEKVSAEFPNIIFVKVDTDKFSALTKEYGIQGLPTVKIYKNGKKIDEYTGNKYSTAAAFRKFVQGLSA